MALIAGRELTILPNDAYRAAHPHSPPIGEPAAPWLAPEPLSRLMEDGLAFRTEAFSCSAVRDEQGRIVGALVVAMETWGAQEKLRESTALLAAISDSSADVIFAKDVEGRLRFANPATLALIGKSQEQVIGKTDAEFLGNVDAAIQVMDNDRRIMDSGEASEVEVR